VEPQKKKGPPPPPSRPALINEARIYRSNVAGGLRTISKVFFTRPLTTPNPRSNKTCHFRLTSPNERCPGGALRPSVARTERAVLGFQSRLIFDLLCSKLRAGDNLEFHRERRTRASLYGTSDGSFSTSVTPTPVPLSAAEFGPGLAERFPDAIEMFFPARRPGELIRPATPTNGKRGPAQHLRRRRKEGRVCASEIPKRAAIRLSKTSSPRIMPAARLRAGKSGNSGRKLHAVCWSKTSLALRRQRTHCRANPQLHLHTNSGTPNLAPRVTRSSRQQAKDRWYLRHPERITSNILELSQ